MKEAVIKGRWYSGMPSTNGKKRSLVFVDSEDEMRGCLPILSAVSCSKTDCYKSGDGVCVEEKGVWGGGAKGREDCNPTLSELFVICDRHCLCSLIGALRDVCPQPEASRRSCESSQENYALMAIAISQSSSVPTTCNK